LLGASLAAFGGRSFSVASALAVGCLLLAGLTPLRLDSRTRLLDLALLAALILCLLQMVPLPSVVVRALVPARATFEETIRLDANETWLTLSLNWRQSGHAFVVFLGAVLMYLSARAMFSKHGVRTVCRGIGWLGLLLACVAIVQYAATPTRIYGVWQAPVGALPFGPFFNRNYCGAWLVMAIPLSFGHLAARMTGGAARTVAISRSLLDSKSLWLAVASTGMILALFLSLSRSAVAGFAVVGFVAPLTLRRRVESTSRLAAAGIVIAILAVGLWFADLEGLLGRFTEAADLHHANRIEIWRETVPIVRDFWLMGTGVGAFGTAMLVYQVTRRAYRYTHAENHYLQVVAEGGVLLAGAVALAAVAFVRTARDCLVDDASGVFWIRAGAAAGLAGVAVQGVWENVLTLPANALLAAVLAALLTHDVRRPEPSRGGGFAP
jgi:hypothetical protein